MTELGSNPMLSSSLRREETDRVQSQKSELEDSSGTLFVSLYSSQLRKARQLDKSWHLISTSHWDEDPCALTASPG